MTKELYRTCTHCGCQWRADINICPQCNVGLAWVMEPLVVQELTKEREAELRKLASLEMQEALGALDSARAEFARMENAWRDRCGPWPGVKNERDTLLACVKEMDKAWRELGGAANEAMLVLKTIKDQKLESNLSGPLAGATWNRLHQLLLNPPITSTRARLKAAGIQIEGDGK